MGDIYCQWYAQLSHNTDFNCGINTKGYGQKWLAGAYEINKYDEISNLKQKVADWEHAANESRARSEELEAKVKKLKSVLSEARDCIKANIHTRLNDETFALIEEMLGK